MSPAGQRVLSRHVGKKARRGLGQLPPPRGREQSVDLTPVVAPCPQKALLTHVMGLPASTSRREFETAVYERVDGDERSVDSLRW